jgi:hypothetical protein
MIQGLQGKQGLEAGLGRPWLAALTVLKLSLPPLPGVHPLHLWLHISTPTCSPSPPAAHLHLSLDKAHFLLQNLMLPQQPLYAIQVFCTLQ